MLILLPALASAAPVGALEQAISDQLASDSALLGTGRSVSNRGEDLTERLREDRGSS